MPAPGVPPPDWVHIQDLKADTAAAWHGLASSSRGEARGPVAQGWCNDLHRSVPAAEACPPPHLGPTAVWHHYRAAPRTPPPLGPGSSGRLGSPPPPARPPPAGPPHLGLLHVLLDALRVPLTHVAVSGAAGWPGPLSWPAPPPPSSSSPTAPPPRPPSPSPRRG